MTIHRSSMVHSTSSCMKTRGSAKRLLDSRFRMRTQMTPQCESTDTTSTSVVTNSVPLPNFQQRCVSSQNCYLSIGPFNDHYIDVISRKWKFLTNSIPWGLLLTALCASVVVVVVEAEEVSQLFHGSSRFLNFAGKSQRDIVVRLTKNLTEDTPVSTLIATFRAEDKDSMTHNLT